MGGFVGGISILILAFIAIRLFAIIRAVQNHQYGWLIIFIVFYNFPLVDLVYLFGFQQKSELTTQQWWEKKTKQVQELFNKKTPKPPEEK